MLNFEYSTPLYSFYDSPIFGTADIDIAQLTCKGYISLADFLYSIFLWIPPILFRCPDIKATEVTLKHYLSSFTYNFRTTKRNWGNPMKHTVCNADLPYLDPPHSPLTACYEDRSMLLTQLAI